MIAKCLGGGPANVLSAGNSQQSSPTRAKPTNPTLDGPLRARDTTHRFAVGKMESNPAR